ncbi:MAG: RluA family pseudouridine synthase [Clostridia bacterium]|nr:RluA family pseudouridine synthase [Clostridia bacterium]MDD4375729.1 RluA family pseudouridine synthase [Clostridia bacterium]
MKLKYIVKKEEDGKLLKEVIKNKYNFSSILRKELINSKAIKVNNKDYYLIHRVKQNDKIDIYLDMTFKETVEKAYTKFKPWDSKIEIIYEDDMLLCINKEAGIPCHPSSNHTKKTLYQALMSYYIKKEDKRPIHITNRLDKNTTGIVVIAKHKYIQEYLAKEMKENRVHKEYIAIVHGNLKAEKGIIEKRIKRKENSIILRETTENEEGECAKTEYEKIKYNEENNYTVIKVILHTGRTHQIRVHFSSVGHPIVGDDLYINECIERGEITKESITARRQMLHANKIKLQLPNGNILSLEAKVPEDMKEII